MDSMDVLGWGLVVVVVLVAAAAVVYLVTSVRRRRLSSGERAELEALRRERDGR